jgi:formiminoglutamase
MAVQIWDQLVATDDAWFYSRQDPNDPRLGDIVLRDRNAYESADVVLLGCPQDEGVRRNRGRSGAAQAPGEIRLAFYRYAVSDEHAGLRLFDAGDIRVRASLEETHDALHTVVRAVLTDGKKVVILGGGNDISYPDCSALAAVYERVLALNIDRHLDVRADSPRNSGTPYRQLIEEGHIPGAALHEIGVNSFANSRSYLRWAEQQGVHVHLLGDVRAAGVGPTVRAIVEADDADAIFFGFDLDVVGAAEAPGVSDPSPMGLSAREVCEIADVAAADPRTRVIEIAEVCPPHDVGSVTSKLAANILVRALAGGPRV